MTVENPLEVRIMLLAAWPGGCVLAARPACYAVCKSVEVAGVGEAAAQDHVQRAVVE